MNELKEAILALLEVLAVLLVMAIVCLVAPGWLKMILWGWR